VNGEYPAPGYAKSYSRSLDAAIRVYDAAGDVIEPHEHTSDFKEWVMPYVRRLALIPCWRHTTFATAMSTGTYGESDAVSQRNRLREVFQSLTQNCDSRLR
jgi:hypothetical protein